MRSLIIVAAFCAVAALGQYTTASYGTGYNQNAGYGTTAGYGTGYGTNQGYGTTGYNTGYGQYSTFGTPNAYQYDANGRFYNSAPSVSAVAAIFSAVAAIALAY